MAKRRLIIPFLAIFAAFLLIFFAFPKKNENRTQQVVGTTSNDLPQNKSLESEKAEPPVPEEKEEETVQQEIPEKYLLEISFYSQAPLSKWDAFHEDMCEEASVLNAAYYLLEKKPTLEKYEEELQAMQKAEKKEIGEWKSTTVSETKKFVDIYFEGKIKSRIIDNPTIEEIETEVAAGNPVVVPLAGRDIGNPNFTPPGPVYHMLVVKGYDKQNFITNDVGTRKGNSYTYRKEVIMKNIHDWNKKDIRLGAKRVLVLLK